MTGHGHSLGSPPFYAVLFITIYGFFGLCWTRSGQTLGMQAWRVCVLNKYHQPISPRQSLIRFIVAIPSLCLFGLGVFWMWFDKDHRSWQDKASSSVTVLLPESPKQ